MTALRAPVVNRTDSFKADVAALLGRFPLLDVVLEEIEDLLRSLWFVPHYPVDEDRYPGVYGVAVDYPPAGSDGLGVFFVTYHATSLTPNPMQHPLRVYTLLTITER